MYPPNLKSVALILPVPELIGGSQKNWGSRSLAMPTLSIPQSPMWLPYRLFIYVHSFSRDFRLQFWVGVTNPNLGDSDRGRRKKKKIYFANNWGSGMVALPFERTLVSFYRPSIYIIPLSALSFGRNFRLQFWVGCEPQSLPLPSSSAFMLGQCDLLVVHLFLRTKCKLARINVLPSTWGRGGRRGRDGTVRKSVSEFI